MNFLSRVWAQRFRLGIKDKKHTQLEVSFGMILLAVWSLKPLEPYLYPIILPLVNPKYHLGNIKGFIYVLHETFMRAFLEAFMKLL